MVIEIAQVIQDFAIIIIVVYRTTHFFSLHYLFLHYHHLERSHKSYHLLTVNRKTSNTSLRLLVYRMYKTEASTGLFLIYILVLSCLSTSIFSQHNQTLAQQADNKIQKFSNRFRKWSKDQCSTNLSCCWQRTISWSLTTGVVLMIRMKHWDLFTRMILNHPHRFGR